MSHLLITGGAGFIGSHTCLVLLNAGHDLLVFDDFSNSSPVALERVQGLTGRSLQCVRGDVRDSALLQQVFARASATGAPIEAVIHFAGLKTVGESIAEPLLYWDVNVGGSYALLSAMAAHDCRCLVFSSSATLYGYPKTVPISETAPIEPINPYGHTKAAVERMLNDLVGSAQGTWRIACLRYFNPVGAHPSGLIGEDPNGIPSNLFPFLSQVAIGRRKILQVFCIDWPTPDGSGVRDYIHVMDLAEGHCAALDVLLAEEPQLLTLNLGSGIGVSVLQLIEAFEEASGRKIPFQVVDRRSGDAAMSIADPSLAAARLKWRTQRSLANICHDGWAWQTANPVGYVSSL